MTELGTRPLRDLCVFKHGGTPSKSNPSFWAGDIPWVSPKDMKQAVIDSATDYISAEAVAGSATSIVPSGSILAVVRSGMLAHSFPIAQVAKPLAFNQDIKAVIPVSEDVDPDYLYWFLRSQSLDVVTRGVKKGATVHSVQSGFIENLKVPMRPREDQRRIVDLLARAEGIVRLRREAQQKAAELIPAVFIEMFGNPATNPKGWPVAKLGELLSSIDSGHSPKCSDRHRGADEWGVLRLGAVSRCEYDETEHKTLPRDIAPDRSIEVKSGDLLLSRKNTAELVGASAYVWTTGGRVLLPDLIFRLQLPEAAQVNAIYLWKLLTTNAKRSALTRLATGSAGSMPNISKERLRTLPVEVPTLELQMKFANLVKEVRSIRQQQQAAIEKAEAVFASLLADAFSGM